MSAARIPLRLILGGAAAVVAVLYVIRKGGIAPAAEGAGRAAVDAAAGVGVGLVKGVGQLVGIPDTSETECEKARRSGDLWRASFVCPAADWGGQVWRRITTPAIDETVLDPRDALARRPASGEARAHVCLPGECGLPGEGGTGAGRNQNPPPPVFDPYVIDGTQTWWVAP